MGDERRWAARLQFLDELWRGRDRIVLDLDVEQALAKSAAEPFADLLERLLPADEEDARAWMALHDERRAATFARARSGTVFVGLDAAAELASDEDWEVALVMLPEPREQMSADLLAFLEVLGDKTSDDPDRTVVLAVPIERDGAKDDAEDRTYEALADLVDELFGDARIYGLARPGMAAFFDFGRVLADEGEGEAGEESIDIEVDNTLGSEQPRFDLFLAVIGDRVPSEGLTYVELPPDEGAPIRATIQAAEKAFVSPAGGEKAGDDEVAALRAQLAEAQRRGDLQAIERLALLEKLEQAEERAAGLGEQLERRHAAAGAVELGSGQTEGGEGPRLDAVLAREQALRWELDRTRAELERLQARPVETLEAEVAALRARLRDSEAESQRLRDRVAEAEGALSALEGGSDELDQFDVIDAELSDALAEQALLDELERSMSVETPARERKRLESLGRLDRTLRKLERGADVSALELHRELVAIRKLLAPRTI